MAHILGQLSAAIDKNHGLSDIEKMNYLNGMLKAEAARAISRLPLTEENYKKAIELLKERFGKPQILTNTYMESLSKIDAPPADTKNLRTFYDTCEKHSRFRGTWSKNGNLWKLIDSHSSKENTRTNSVLNIQS